MERNQGSVNRISTFPGYSTLPSRFPNDPGFRIKQVEDAIMQMMYGDIAGLNSTASPGV
jgi:hypothetical protein